MHSLCLLNDYNDPSDSEVPAQVLACHETLVRVGKTNK
jgi:hypothetical protein